MVGCVVGERRENRGGERAWLKIFNIGLSRTDLKYI